MHWERERESSFGSLGLGKDKKSSLFFGEVEKNFQVWFSWFPVHFFSIFEICALMLKIIFFFFFTLVMVWVWITCGMVFEFSPFHTIPLSSLLCLDVVCWVIEKSLPNHICLLEEIDHLYIMDRDHRNSNSIITIFLFWYPLSYGLGPLILISTFWFWELGG